MNTSPLSRKDFQDLKDSGFPMHNRLKGTACGNCFSGCLICGLDTCMPTLPELISECGGEFGSLEKLGDQYIALQPKHRQTIPVLTYCLSAEEAVKNLYVALSHARQLR